MKKENIHKRLKKLRCHHSVLSSSWLTTDILPLHHHNLNNKVEKKKFSMTGDSDR